ncbi:ATP-binding cassette domain-containing protein, partial [Streptomyces sp. NPDC059468]
MSSAIATEPGRRTGVVVEQVVRQFGDRVVLDQLDLAIADEELVILLGPSGCGKSTLLRLLAGLDRPDGGRVEVPAKRAIVFQADRLLPWQRVLRNVTLGLHGPDAEQRARDVLAEVGLAGREKAWPK